MEQDLDQLLHTNTSLILINIWQDDCEASVYMEQLMQAFEHYASALILRLDLTEYRDWAQAHGVYGTPALIVYRNGRPLFRMLGRVTPTELLQRLCQHGVEDL